VQGLADIALAVAPGQTHCPVPRWLGRCPSEADADIKDGDSPVPITDRTVRVPISDIRVKRDERQRREVETKSLESSIARIGLLQPIIITSELELRAGERRLTACKNLGHLDILCRFAEDLSPVESNIIELEENIKRTDLPWVDLVQAITKIHQLYRELNADQTISETAEQLSLSQNFISKCIILTSYLGEERIREAKTMPDAYNVILRRQQRAAGDALQELLETPDLPPSQIAAMSESFDSLPEPMPGRYDPPLPPAEPPPIIPAEQSILLESFLDWAPRYRGPKFSFIHCDFPYGIEFASGPQGLGSESSVYEDKPDLYFALLECLCQNIDRLMSVSGHLMFWYSAKHIDATRDIFRRRAPSLGFHLHPLVWVKSDGAGIASDPRMGPRHTYETALFANRGRRQIVRVVADSYSSPTDKRLHVSTKPAPMLKHFMAMIVDETTSMLDPTCGSGAALRAAESLGAKHVLGLEIDPVSAELARTALKQERQTRRAAAVATMPRLVGAMAGGK